MHNWSFPPELLATIIQLQLDGKITVMEAKRLIREYLDDRYGITGGKNDK